jgi:hypothetical protein
MKLLIENWRKFLTEISAEEIKWFRPGIAKLAMDPSVQFLHTHGAEKK